MLQSNFRVVVCLENLLLPRSRELEGKCKQQEALPIVNEFQPRLSLCDAGNIK